MNNTEKLYIAKQAGFLKRLAQSAMGSRGQTALIRSTSNRYINEPPNKWLDYISRMAQQIRKSPGVTPYEPTLWGAKGLKGLTRPKLKQLKNPPTLEPHNWPGYKGDPNETYGFTNTLKNPQVDTPLAKLLKQLGLGTAAGGIAYGAKKGLDADNYYY